MSRRHRRSSSSSSSSSGTGTAIGCGAIICCIPLIIFGFITWPLCCFKTNKQRLFVYGTSSVVVFVLLLVFIGYCEQHATTCYYKGDTPPTGASPPWIIESYKAAGSWWNWMWSRGPMGLTLCAILTVAYPIATVHFAGRYVKERQQARDETETGRRIQELDQQIWTVEQRLAQYQARYSANPPTATIER